MRSGFAPAGIIDKLNKEINAGERASILGE
jgi:hypothetical protein